MKKFALTLAIAITLIFVDAPNTYTYAGSDLYVTCINDDCILEGDSPLFLEENIYPGATTSQKIFVKNGQDENCNLILRTKNEWEKPENFTSNMLTSIKQGNRKSYVVAKDGHTSSLKTLKDIFLSDYVNLGTIESHTSSEFDWTVTFSPTSGNELQAAKTGFDFDLTFTCADDIPTDEPSFLQEKKENQNDNNGESNNNDSDNSDNNDEKNEDHSNTKNNLSQNKNNETGGKNSKENTNYSGIMETQTDKKISPDTASSLKNQDTNNPRVKGISVQRATKIIPLYPRNKTPLKLKTSWQNVILIQILIHIAIRLLFRFLSKVSSRKSKIYYFSQLTIAGLSACIIFINWGFGYELLAAISAGVIAAEF